MTPDALEMLTLAVDDGVATVTVNRPDKLNALNDATIRELGIAIDTVRERSDVAGIIVTGAGRAFVAGADIAELASQSAVDAQARARRGQEVFSRFESSPKPVVAAVNGFALGGGCELAMACHLRIASEAAKFGQPEVKLGIVPGYGGTQRLPRLVGMGRALQILLTGEMIDAAEAYRIGLVNAVVPASELLPTAVRLLRSIIAHGPLAIALTLDAVRRGMDTSLDDGLALEASAFGVLSATGDMREGMRAFLDKRPPSFRGA